jgi:hypothetical protein
MADDIELLPEPISIADARSDYVAHVIPEAAAGPARYRVGPVRGHEAPFTMATILIHADGSVTACGCHEPVVEDGYVTGLKEVLRASHD